MVINMLHQLVLQWMKHLSVLQTDRQQTSGRRSRFTVCLHGAAVEHLVVVGREPVTPTPRPPTYRSVPHRAAGCLLLLSLNQVQMFLLMKPLGDFGSGEANWVWAHVHLCVNDSLCACAHLRWCTLSRHCGVDPLTSWLVVPCVKMCCLKL